jgi:hypothetical protein
MTPRLSHKRALVVPEALVVTALSAVATSLLGCPAQTAPGACFAGWMPPAGISPGLSSASNRPVVSLTPCPPQSDGINPSCMTAAGCTVIYNYANGGFAAGTSAQLVVCPAMGQCVWSINASGQSVFGACPSTDQPSTECSNQYRLDDPAKTAFVCESPRIICNMPSGQQGMLTARVERRVTGEVLSTACPSPCEPFA